VIVDGAWEAGCLARLSAARAEEGRREVGPFSRASRDFQ